MMLRNGKRKLDFAECVPVRKKKYKPQSPKKILYVNDANTKPDEFGVLWNMSEREGIWVIQERIEGGAYKSEEDFAQRVSWIKGDSSRTLEDSNVQIVFSTRGDKAVQLMYDALLSVKWVHDLFVNDELQVLKLVAEYSIGQIAICDRKNCHNTIVLVDHDEIHQHSKPDQKYQTEEKMMEPFVLSKEDYCVYEYDPKYWYYFRAEKWYYDLSYIDDGRLPPALYCKNCYKELRNCFNCQVGIYFDNDQSTYEICPGDHLLCWQEDEEETEYIDFHYKKCKRCGPVCWLHRSRGIQYTQFHCGCRHPECYLQASARWCWSGQWHLQVWGVCFQTASDEDWRGLDCLFSDRSISMHLSLIGVCGGIDYLWKKQTIICTYSKS